MEKEFIPYEQALALKELGFDEPCFTYYGNISQALFGLKGNIEFRTNTLLDNSHGKNIVSSAPTFSQAFRWFREKYKFDLKIQHNKKYVAIVYSSVKNFSIDEYETYEEAELECLKKLISIIKNK